MERITRYILTNISNNNSILSFIMKIGSDEDWETFFREIYMNAIPLPPDIEFEPDEFPELCTEK